MGNLILSRRVGERLRILLGDTEVWLTVTHVQPGRRPRAFLSIEAPDDVRIDREEVVRLNQDRSGEGPNHCGGAGRDARSD